MISEAWTGRGRGRVGMGYIFHSVVGLSQSDQERYKIQNCSDILDYSFFGGGQGPVLGPYIFQEDFPNYGNYGILEVEKTHRR